ncbi:MAG: DUF4062 domain-containing protein [Gallionella sp.]|nr:DUF4062 domain-containing protein [Gallionella sp.]
MARLRVFVSSTCYDLNVIRSELRPFISGMGYEPVMSDHSDILFDHRSHTHDSCLKEVMGCDVVILIIGSRFGGNAVPSALANLDFSQLEQLSTKSSILEAKEKLSITQLEVLKAIQQSIPVYTFVDSDVLHDHRVYEKNKDKKDVIDGMDFPSIQKRETAKYIFEFINFLSHRITDNSITGFSRLDEIRTHLASQWSQMFQRLLFESRTKTQETYRYRDFSEQIEDLKAVVLASLATPSLRETAKGAVQFRHLIGFISALKFVDHRQLLLSKLTWEDVLKTARIQEVRAQNSGDRVFRHELFLVLDDGTFYRARYSQRALDDFRSNWDNFLKLDSHAREAIVAALLEDREAGRMMLLRYFEQNIDEYLAERNLDVPNDIIEVG